MIPMSALLIIMSASATAQNSGVVSIYETGSHPSGITYASELFGNSTTHVDITPAPGTTSLPTAPGTYGVELPSINANFVLTFTLSRGSHVAYAGSGSMPNGVSVSATSMKRIRPNTKATL